MGPAWPVQPPVAAAALGRRLHLHVCHGAQLRAAQPQPGVRPGEQPRALHFDDVGRWHRPHRRRQLCKCLPQQRWRLLRVADVGQLPAFAAAAVGWRQAGRSAFDVAAAAVAAAVAAADAHAAVAVGAVGRVPRLLHHGSRLDAVPQPRVRPADD